MWLDTSGYEGLPVQQEFDIAGLVPFTWRCCLHVSGKTKCRFAAW